MQKAGIPSGTRDFSPDTVEKRKFLLKTIENRFKIFGFVPLETPAMENLETLSGKYGDEGDQLLFKILNSGDYLIKSDKSAFEETNSKKFTPSVAEKGLRYDLTVPFARYVAMHRHELTFPFRRYQMQPVWRADRPQKGRYREFWQCDGDIVGTDSLVCEIELLNLYSVIFADLTLPVIIRYNNRKILDEIAVKVGMSEFLRDLLIIIDKVDKIGEQGVEDLISKQSFAEKGIRYWKILQEVKNIKTLDNQIEFLSNFLGQGSIAMEELVFVSKNAPADSNFDIMLARGLNYYTGTIVEVIPDKTKLMQDINMGSIGGGGRYDNLTGIFGLDGVSGVGISFGLDRIYDLIDACSLFPEMNTLNTKLIFCCFDQKAIDYSLPMVFSLRALNIVTEIYPGTAKIKKQLEYASNKKIEYCVIVGDTEVETGELTLKNMETGEQIKTNFNQLTKLFTH